jgi:tetratricopeptide (TPR) repeat protein
MAGFLLLAGVSGAESIPAKLTLGGGRVWSGELLGRDGDWIEFQKSGSGKPLRIGASTVKKIDFTVNVDAKKISALMRDRNFADAIRLLKLAISPFSAYSDVPSNLTRYNLLLMELLYQAGDYEASLEISSKIAEDTKDDSTYKRKAIVYQILALVDSGQKEKADEALAAHGWDQLPPDDASAERLYITAKVLMGKGEYQKAIELASKVVAFYSQDPDWAQPAELLCAELYIKLGRYESAEEVCREISIFYKDTLESDAAKRLKIKIEKLRAQERLKESLKSGEA